MQPLEIIQRYYAAEPELHRLLVIHSVLVAQKAYELALELFDRQERVAVDLEFLTEAALLHDIGIRECHAPEILCHGTEPYIRHGLCGQRLLDSLGYPRHGLVCVRHTGVGIPREEVRARNLPLPEDDYLPVSIEEKIICVADKFYSKTPDKLWKRKQVDKITKGLAKFGPEALMRWHRLRFEIMNY